MTFPALVVLDVVDVDRAAVVGEHVTDSVVRARVDAVADGELAGLLEDRPVGADDQPRVGLAEQDRRATPRRCAGSARTAGSELDPPPSRNAPSLDAAPLELAGALQGGDRKRCCPEEGVLLTVDLRVGVSRRQWSGRRCRRHHSCSWRPSPRGGRRRCTAPSEPAKPGRAGLHPSARPHARGRLPAPPRGRRSRRPGRWRRTGHRRSRAASPRARSAGSRAR